MRVLDAGCGTGRNLGLIASAGARPFGVDLGTARVAEHPGDVVQQQGTELCWLVQPQLVAGVEHFVLRVR